MLKNLNTDHIYIVCGHTDMRKSIDGLAAIIQQQYQLDLFSNSAFLFCGKRRNRMKVLLWEDSGFLLLYLLTVLPEMGTDPTEDQIKSVMPWSFALPAYCKQTYSEIQ